MAIIRDWLTAMGKRPFCSGDSTIWNWASEKEWDPAEKDMCVPHEIYQEMTGRIGYPGCRMYFSEEEAIVDFEQACAKLGTVFVETPPGYQRKPVDREMLEASKAARERGEHGEDIATVITRLMTQGAP